MTAAIGPAGDFQPDRRIDARGRIVAPGLVDLAVRLHGEDRPNGFDDVSFMHHALPGTCIDTVDTRTEVLGATWGLPLYINAMTGGTPKTAAINADLARAAAGA